MRHRDLQYPATGRDKHENETSQSKAGVEFAVSESRLARRIRELTTNEAGLVALLQNIAPVDAVMARIVVIRELGGARAGRLLERAFGSAAMPIASVAEAEATAAPEPLVAGVREKMEGAFGQSFGDVRIHRDSPRASGTIEALTEGSEIHFGPGRFQPDTPSGNHLIAHELAHVAQRRHSRTLPAHLTSVDHRGLLEHDAERAAQRAVAGQRASVRFHASPSSAFHYESWEHKQLGDAGGGGRKITIRCGLELTYGEVVALSGDFYSSPDKLDNAPKEEVLKLLAMIHREEREAGANGGRPTKEQAVENDADSQAATAWRERSVYAGGIRQGAEGAEKGGETKSYLTLANANDNHFSPDNITEWKLLHAQALSIAGENFARQNSSSSGRGCGRLNEALLIDAAACHFLTDAFSSGHLVNGKAARETWVPAFWQKEAANIHRAMLTAAASDHVVATFALGPLPIATAVKASLIAVQGHRGSLGLKLVHDHLNGLGLRVRNARGDEWLTFGDAKLAAAPRTRELASEAVRLSREQVEKKASTGETDPSLDANTLVPNQVYYRGQFSKKEAFYGDESLFTEVFRPLILDPSRENPLYQLIRGNLIGVLKDQITEGAIEAGRWFEGVAVPATDSLVEGTEE